MMLFLCILLTFFHCYLSEHITYHVKEESNPYTYVGDIATDLQTSDNSFLKNKDLITFSQLQQKGEQLFNVTKTGKLYTVQTLDAESVCSYEKECFEIVKVAVHKSKTFMKILKMKVIIEDINDHQPEFPTKQVNIQFSERDGRGSKLSIPNAVDKDIGYQNSLIKYELQDNEGHFLLSVSKEADGISTLEIILEDKLDREKKDSYNIEVIAKDGGTPARQSILNVKISVKGENDNTIQELNIINQHNNLPNIDVNFISTENHNTATILEDIKVGSFIAYVMVTDNDVGDNGEVSCDIKHDTFKLQSMGSKKYKIVLKKAVDRETQEHYHFTVSCQDKGLPPLKTDKDLSIQVLDVNDVKPRFTKDKFKFLTNENDKANFPIGFINATDPDVGKGGELSYYLKNKHQYRLPFQMNKSGFISTNQSLDREHRDFYDFEVLVKDNGTPSLNNTVNVEVEVLDKNDNAPYFTFPNVDPFSLDVYYHPQSKNDITVLRASDRDNGNNAFPRYEIFSGNEGQLFKLNSFTGVLSYSRTIYQNDAGSYQLEFVVKDCGTPVMSATTGILLKINFDDKIYLHNTASTKSKPVNLTLKIIIVGACVLISLVIIVSITVCTFKCIRVKQNFNTSMLPSILEMNDVCNQTESPTTSKVDNIYWQTIPEMNKSQLVSCNGFYEMPRPFPTMYSEKINPTADTQYLKPTLDYSNSGEFSGKEELHLYEEVSEKLGMKSCETPELINDDKDK